MCVQIIHTTIYILFLPKYIMDRLDLDHEIIMTHEAINQLEKSGDKGALEYAKRDLSYFLNLLDV